jgi:hypothetical protein
MFAETKENLLNGERLPYRDLRAKVAESLSSHEALVLCEVPSTAFLCNLHDLNTFPCGNPVDFFWMSVPAYG